MYALFAPLGTISLRLLGVSSNTGNLESTSISGGLFPLNTTLVKPLQSSKAPAPMLVTERGMVILVKRLQAAKALAPMLMTELGILTLVKLLQP